MKNWPLECQSLIKNNATSMFWPGQDKNAIRLPGDHPGKQRQNPSTFCSTFRVMDADERYLLLPGRSKGTRPVWTGSPTDDRLSSVLLSRPGTSMNNVDRCVSLLLRVQCAIIRRYRGRQRCVRRLSNSASCSPARLTRQRHHRHCRAGRGPQGVGSNNGITQHFAVRAWISQQLHTLIEAIICLPDLPQQMKIRDGFWVSPPAEDENVFVVSGMQQIRQQFLGWIGNPLNSAGSGERSRSSRLCKTTKTDSVGSIQV